MMLFHRLFAPFLGVGLSLLAAPTLAAIDIEAGRAKAAVCQACHGADFNTTTQHWPKLAGQSAAYALKQLHDFAKGEAGCRPNPTMLGIAKSLNDEDKANISAYLASLPTAVGVASKTRLARGEQLYRAGDRDKHIAACMACHGPAGEGIASAKFPSVGGQNAGYVTAQIKAFRSRSRCNDPHAMMRDIAQRMSDEDIRAVANYMQGLHRNPLPVQ